MHQFEYYEPLISKFSAIISQRVRLLFGKYVGKKGIDCHADRQEISRCRTKGESEESIVRKRETHPGFETQASPHQGFQLPHKKGPK